MFTKPCVRFLYKTHKLNSYILPYGFRPVFRARFKEKFFPYHDHFPYDSTTYFQNFLTTIIKNIID